MVVRGIEPFAVALNMPPATSASSGMNWLGSGRRERRSSWLAVAGVDMAGIPSNLSGVDGVYVVRRHSRPECEVTHRLHSLVCCLVGLVRADATEGAARDEQPIRARTRPVRPGPGRDHGRAAS